MQARLIHEAHGQRTFAVVLETGDEVVSVLTGLAAREALEAAQVTAIGAFSDAVLGYFDWQTKDYRRIPVHEQVEVAAFVGDIVLGEDGQGSVHAHVVLGRQDARPWPGISSRRMSGLRSKSWSPRARRISASGGTRKVALP